MSDCKRNRLEKEDGLRNMKSLGNPAAADCAADQATLQEAVRDCLFLWRFSGKSEENE